MTVTPSRSRIAYSSSWMSVWVRSRKRTDCCRPSTLLLLLLLVSTYLPKGGVEAAEVVLQAAHGAVALQDLGRAVVLHARVAAKHAFLRTAVRAVPLTLGHLSGVVVIRC